MNVESTLPYFEEDNELVVVPEEACVSSDELASTEYQETTSSVLDVEEDKDEGIILYANNNTQEYEALVYFAQQNHSDIQTLKMDIANLMVSQTLIICGLLVAITAFRGLAE